MKDLKLIFSSVILSSEERTKGYHGKFFTVVIQPLSTQLIKRNFCMAKLLVMSCAIFLSNIIVQSDDPQ